MSNVILMSQNVNSRSSEIEKLSNKLSPVHLEISEKKIQLVKITVAVLP